MFKWETLQRELSRVVFLAMKEFAIEWRGFVELTSKNKSWRNFVEFLKLYLYFFENLM